MTLAKDQTRGPTEIQTLVTSAFPNITSINVAETVQNVAELVGKLALGLKLASRSTLALGVLVFLLVLLFQLVSARADVQQLRMLGLTPWQIWSFQTLSYGALSVIGTWIGAVLAIAVSWAIVFFGFDGRIEINILAILQIWTMSLGASVLGIGTLSFREIKNARNQLELGSGQL